MRHLFLSFLFLTTISNAQFIQWIQNTGGVSIAVDQSGYVFTVDYDYNPAGDIYLTKRDANGNHVWTEKFDQTDNSKWEKATWVETDNLGNAIVTGNLMSGYSNPVNAASIVMKFSPAGTLLWRNVYESSFDGSYTKKCLVDASNNIYVLGIGNPGSGQASKVKKFAPDGSTVWTYHNPTGIGAPLNFKFTPDNGIVISARGITGSINGFAKLTMNGIHSWSIAGINSITIGDVAGDANGNSYVVSGLFGSNTESIVRKVDLSGSTIWQNNFSIAGLRIEIGNDDLPVVSGYPNTGSFGSAFIKVSSNGGLIWSNLDADSTFSLMLHAQIKMDPFNNVYLAAGTMTQMAVCRINSNGSSGWTMAMPGGYANAIDIGLDNSVYVVGGSTTSGATGRIMQSVTGTYGNTGMVPISSWLGNNYPNPFNPSTKITFGLSRSGNIKLAVYDVSGRELGILLDEFRNAGEYELSFDGNQLPSGVYFYKLSGNDISESKKMILIK
jgi:Secretion system C-terminal sorting domain